MEPILPALTKSTFVSDQEYNWVKNDSITVSCDMIEYKQEIFCTPKGWDVTAFNSTCQKGNPNLVIFR